MMTKRNLFMLFSTVVLLSACQPQTAKEMSSQDKVVTVATKTQVLERGSWEEKLYARLSQLIAENGKDSSDYDPNNKPYAVFDWDNTTIINDIGEATFTYQIANLAFKMTPEQFDHAIRHNLPQNDFSLEYHNKDGQAVNIDKIAQDLLSDYTFLYNHYSGLKGSQSLEAIKATDEYKDFSAKLRYLYEAIGDTFSFYINYPWVTYLYAGMTSEEVYALTAKSIDFALSDDLVYETWESPESLKGQAGQVSVTFKRGIRSIKEMQNLYQVLMANGIDVYICSDSFEDVIYEYATNPKYGYNVPKENVRGMRLLKDADGIIQAELDPTFPQTQREGKRETIRRWMVRKHGGKAPILIAGDSNGDYDMMVDFPDMQMGIVFNLLPTPNKGIAHLVKEAIETYEADDAKYFLQGRDENQGVLIETRETIKLGTDDAKLMKE